MAEVFLKANENDVITIWDATYIYIEKSNSYSFQKAGTIVESIGPFFLNGNINDAKILENIINKIREANKWFYEDDIFVIDRGFRDSIKLFQNK